MSHCTCNPAPDADGLTPQQRDCASRMGQLAAEMVRQHATPFLVLGLGVAGPHKGVPVAICLDPPSPREVVELLRALADRLEANANVSLE